ncbi:type I phosphomannose isomerase catalytic subunit [Williamsoniiplasma luminosum]|uniref:Mannose-6-phosphate isomerase n=1 Tax=Williamsoniiplasma luminosum TaxID=214888 RepID=A0A2S0NL79_9MOLU|nr:type I phosphomannose isomerase catalytic subunit [Williamsoniiplasma luminosum]AVP49765.1 MAG: mannose-6-phosphate isomerase [Williamsoniiplasma luminosum]
MEIIKLKPFFSEKIWGGNGLKKMGFDIPLNKNIGEAWIVSAHENGMSFLTSGKFKGQALKNVFEDNRQLFGDYQGEFPLLVKIISPNDYLSVQVHPDDEYALKKHHCLGKPESWLVLDAPVDADLIYGHHAKTKQELESMVEHDQWDQLLKKVKVQVGDFLYVEPGKVHAITPGVVVCEVQRSSDITYRFYDYKRLDDHGQPRRLDLEDSINCTLIPDSQDVIVRQQTGQIFSSKYFSINIWDTKNNLKLEIDEQPYWLQLTVLSGQGTINNQDFQIGESAITLGSIEQITATGEMKILVSWIKK